MGIMNFFGKSEGGFMDIIRCDEQEYLVHKWSPNGVANSSDKENAIRFGSTLRVKEGEVAVFVYKQQDGTMMDYIVGPVDKTIKTINLPILTEIIGLAYGGDSPFQAEVYFINLSGNVQIRFGIPYFDVFDPRFIDLGIPCAVRGTITFNITDYKNFIKLNRLTNFEISDLKRQIEDFFTRKAKSIILNLPTDTGIPVVQMERKIDEINTILQEKIQSTMQNDFGINLKRIDISAIEIDKTHPNYMQLKKTTADQQTRFIDAKTGIEITNLSEVNRIQRKDMEMGVEADNFAVHKLNQQTEVLKSASGNIGGMGDGNLSGGSGFNPAGIMTGMAMGRVMGDQLNDMMNNSNNTPPPPPTLLYHIALNGQQSGPYTLEQLKEYAVTGQFTKQHHAWKQGMTEWILVENIPELAGAFPQVPPPPPAPPESESTKTSTIDLNKKR